RLRLGRQGPGGPDALRAGRLWPHGRSRRRCDRDRALSLAIAPAADGGRRGARPRGGGAPAVIGYLRGTVRRATPEQVVVDVGGVGYLVSVPAGVRERIGRVGSQVELHVHTHVREDALSLFGFATPEELELF